MSYIKFNLVFDKGAQKGAEAPVKIQMPPILMKFKTYVFAIKQERFLKFQLLSIIVSHPNMGVTT